MVSLGKARWGVPVGRGKVHAPLVWILMNGSVNQEKGTEARIHTDDQ